MMGLLVLTLSRCRTNIGMFSGVIALVCCNLRKVWLPICVLNACDAVWSKTREPISI